MKNHLFSSPILILLFSGLLMTSCASMKMASYDQYSYQKTIDIKVMTIWLMDRSIDPYKEYQAMAEDLSMEVEKMMLYEQNRPNNEVSYQMWKLMNDEDKTFIAGYLKKWRENEQFSKAFVEEAKQQMDEALNTLIGFESKKDEQSKTRLKNLILKNR